MAQDQCPFCQLVANPEQTYDVHETEHFKAWLDINPRARGHTMVVPKDHLERMDALGDHIPELFEVLRVVAEKARNGLDADGVSIVLNDGEAAGQRLDHFYAQVFPRYEGEENAGAPAGAVFQPLEDADESDLESWSDAMASASFTEFRASKEGPASDMLRTTSNSEKDTEDDESERHQWDDDPAEFT